MSDCALTKVMECFICGDNRPPLITSSRIAGLREASCLRGDGLLQKLEDGADNVLCHRNCMQTYCSKVHIQRLLRKRQPAEVLETDTKRLRGGIRAGASTFHFAQHCFFCGEDCDVNVDKKNPKRWRKAYMCRTGTEAWQKTSKQEILKRCSDRGDEWGREVEFRVQSALSDLHAQDGRYHKDCYCKFYCNVSSKTTTHESDSALDQVLHQMRYDKTRMWNSVEIHASYTELGGVKHSRRSLIKAISDSLSPDLLILSSPGVASLLVFRSKASKDLQIVDDKDDCIAQAISSLAATIRAECPNSDSSTYQTRLSKTQVLDTCSPTLLSLLSALSDKLDSTLPAAMIGNIVSSVVTGQATSLQLGLSVLLSRHRKAIDELHAYGVTSSYDELRRFRISAATAMSSIQRTMMPFDSTKGLVQVVADNFDANIASQNGQKASHGLAVIVTQANQQNPQQVNDSADIPKITRLKTEELKACKLNLAEVQVQRFDGQKKPCMPEEYSVKPVPSPEVLERRKASLNRVAIEDLAFFKAVISEDPCPEYGGYNTQRARENNQQPGTKTGLMYTPFLDMSPAEPDTMKTAMVEAQRLSALSGQRWTVFTNDQQLYQVAVHITWVDKELFQNFVPRLGGMHTLMSFVGCIGTLMDGSGLGQVLETTFAGVQKMLSGKKYPQNVRALRLLVEELLRPILGSEDIKTMAELSAILARFSSLSNTTKLWVNCCIEAVIIIMAFVRAEREADWPLHLFAVEKMMPYFFAAGHFNYARYGLYYLRSMQRLHPGLEKKFLDGEHVMRHEAGIWNGLWSDLFIETTYMRYGHGPSGIIGSTLNESTLAIWAYSHSTVTQIIHDLQEMKEGQERLSTVTSHKEEENTRLKEDVADRQKIREALTTCLDVFDASTHPKTGIINIFSGQVVDEPSLNVHDAVEIGAAQCQEFETQWPDSFHNKLHKNVRTMVSVTKKTTKDQTRSPCLDTEFIYARVLGIMASPRDSMSLETLFSHELAPHPTALFDNNGDMRTTTKSVLKSKLQVMSGTHGQESPAVVILDACAVLWTVPWPALPAKVSDFVTSAVATILRHAAATQVLHVVFDRYHNLSTKSCCRATRQKGCCRTYTLTENTPLPKQSLVLNTTANKTQVIQLIVERMSAMNPLPETQIIITGPDPNPVHVGVGPLQTEVQHEEADVLMAFHMIQEAKAGNKSIKVVSDDTDVLIILAHHLHFRTNWLPRDVDLTMESCSANPSVIDVSEVIKTHKNVMPNLLCAHALTGCDTVSSFAGVGKATVLKKLQSFSGHMKLGDLTEQKEKIIEECLHFIAMLYNQEQGQDLTSMRAEIFRCKIAGKRHVAPKLCNLPPTMGSFEAHCLRAHHQAALWKAAGDPTVPDISPLTCGWEVCGPTLIPQHGLQEQLPAPAEVLNLISCSCKTKCSTTRCSCTKMLLTCTEFCKCKGHVQCKNPMTVAMTEAEGDESDCAEMESSA